MNWLCFVSGQKTQAGTAQTAKQIKTIETKSKKRYYSKQYINLMVTFDEEKQKKTLEELRGREEEDLARMLSEKHGFKYVNLATFSVDARALAILPEKQAREAGLAPFKLENKKLFVAILPTYDNKTIAAVKDLEARGYNIEIFIVSHASQEKVFARYKDLAKETTTTPGVVGITEEYINQLRDKTRTTQDLANEIGRTVISKEVYRISKTIEVILAGSLLTKASDVHIEPEEESVRIRFRLNGILTEVINIDSKTYNLLLSRIKILSKIKLNVKNEPQDGRFTLRTNNLDIEIRTSVLPGAYGESVVLRILNPESILSLADLGMRPEILKTVQDQLKKPNGLILNTGPTGSGKTTTLYAFLRNVHTPDIKIITIEDPIEYHLPGIVQTQIQKNKSYTFATGLRSAVRQDPDMVMVGEIRDLETAEVAVRAALTGHLVFSTLHTNSAAGAFTRLADLGLNLGIVGSAINMAMAQRLVRKLCPHCRQKIALEGEEREVVEAVLKGIGQPEIIEQREHIWKPVGCDKCLGTGYSGRIGIYEVIINTGEITEMLQSETFSERKIRNAGAKAGLPDMKQDAVLKVLAGETSLEEIERVIDLDKY